MRIIRDFIAQDDDFELPEEIKNGSIFEFKTMEQATAFANEVKRLFDLDSRVFDDVEKAYRAHMNPYEQTPPVVHVDRSTWGYFKINPELAQEFKRTVKRKAKEIAKYEFNAADIPPRTSSSWPPRKWSEPWPRGLVAPGSAPSRGLGGQSPKSSLWTAHRPHLHLDALHQPTKEF
jgi:hypothetical protein